MKKNIFEMNEVYCNLEITIFLIIHFTISWIHFRMKFNDDDSRKRWILKFFLCLFMNFVLLVLFLINSKVHEYMELNHFDFIFFVFFCFMQVLSLTVVVLHQTIIIEWKHKLKNKYKS